MGIQLVPPVQALRANYPTDSRPKLAEAMGFPFKDVEAMWENTCAIRLSYCLLKCGISLGVEPGRGDETKIRAGSQKGKHYWMGQKTLSNRLKEVFGKPQYTGLSVDDIQSAIGQGGGVVSFYSMSTYAGGHIDVVYYDDSFWGGIVDKYDLMIEDAEGTSTMSKILKFYFDAKATDSEMRFWRSA